MSTDRHKRRDRSIGQRHTDLGIRLYEAEASHKAKRLAIADIAEELELLARDSHEVSAIEEALSVFKTDRQLRADWHEEYLNDLAMQAEWAREYDWQSDASWGPMGSPAHQHDMMQAEHVHAVSLDDLDDA